MIACLSITLKSDKDLVVGTIRCFELVKKSYRYVFGLLDIR